MHSLALILPSSSVQNSTGQSFWRRGVLCPALAVALFAFSPAARAVTPATDGGYPGDNTAEGSDALFKNTTGSDNTAIGFDALFTNATGSENTANGAFALNLNTTGSQNTA